MNEHNHRHTDIADKIATCIAGEYHRQVSQHAAAIEHERWKREGASAQKCGTLVIHFCMPHAISQHVKRIQRVATELVARN
jgi:hypothetical protein